MTSHIRDADMEFNEKRMGLDHIYKKCDKAEFLRFIDESKWIYSYVGSKLREERE